MRLVVLCAPAGYSKTTTLHSWADADRRPFLWIACGRRHDDPACLIGAIASALAKITPIDEETTAALEIEASWPDRAIARLGRSLEVECPQFALVIDDAHLLKSPGSVAILESLSEILPAQAQLVIGSREAPPLRLGRMRANRDLLELGIADLAMTRRESQRLLQGAGLGLDEHQVKLIHDRTEGWPAALHLASLALSGSDDLAVAVEAFAGNDRAVAEYLRDEFLSVSDPGLVEFMTRTSILETLSGPACDETLERTDSARILQQLARSNALVIPLDRKDETYRYHHLFADMLRSELIRSEPERVGDLHAKASLWYTKNSETELAVEHAIESGDSCLAGCLIWKSLPELSGRGRIATLDRWLADVGQDRFSECHGLVFTAAHTSMMAGAGDRAAYWLSFASELEPPPDCPVQIAADLAMLRATHAMDGTASMGSDAGKVLALKAPDSVWRGAANFYLGVSKHLLGDSEAAVPVLRDAARLTAAESPIIQSLALAQLAMIAHEDDDPKAAAQLVSAARGQVDRCGLAEFPAMTLVYAIESMVLALEGRSGKALAGLTAGCRLLERLNSFPPWYEAETRLAFARACLQLESIGEARSMLRQARVHLDLTPDAVVLEGWFSGLQEDINERFGDRARASQLTRAEMRTLQYLPTHLSFRQVGAANHVSQNTVKTQARSIYRKLGVNSRAEAVEAARTAGLFDREVPTP
jgi:LuxR family maltose regulon positive regulatory protein